MKFCDRDYNVNQKVYDSDKMGYINFVDEFIRQYEPPYFIGNRSEKDASGRTINQSSRLAEGEMQNYLDKGIMHSEDVIKILEWKIGRIDHKTSEKKGKVCYKDTPFDEFAVRGMFGKQIKVKELCDYIASEYSSLSVQTPEEIYNNLLHFNISGLGTVYLLTLVYFISKGESPIYDRFARQALKAVENGLETRKDEVPKYELPDKNSKKAFSSFEEHYSRKLKAMFPNDYKKRELDRALWVYGHLFKVKKTRTDC